MNNNQQYVFNNENGDLPAEHLDLSNKTTDFTIFNLQNKSD